MATWFAQNSSVNIDSVGQWNSVAGGGGTVLTWASLAAGDILVANGKTSITINVNTTCATLTTAATGGTAGGGFILSSGVTVTANIMGGTTACITFSAVTPASATIIGSVNSAIGGAGISHTGTGTLNLTGNVTHGGNISPGISVSGTGTLNVTGIVTGGPAGAGQNQAAIYIGGNAIINVTGDVYGATAATSNNGHGIWIAAACTVNVTGNIYGPTAGAPTQAGVYLSSTGSLNVIGNVYGGSSVGFIGIYSTSTGTISVVGEIQSSTSSPGFYTTSTALLLHTGNMTAASNGQVAVASAYGKHLIHTSNTITHTYRVNNAGVAGAARSLYTGGVNLGQPVVANVRSGTIFGASSEYTGTLAVPSPTLVAIGVSTDNTVGSYNPSVNASDIRSAVGLAAANLDTQLSTLATPAQVNAQVLDVLSVDTFGELSSPPNATSSLKDKITWIFMWARNKISQSQTERKLYADNDSTVVSTESTVDNANQFTKGKTL